MTTRATHPTAVAYWLQDFRHRQDQHRRVKLPSDATLGPDATVLAKSLAVFQVGESGEGAKLFDEARKINLDPGHLEALELFVREEQEHARLLALILDQVNHPVNKAHWTDAVFIWARQLFGFRGEILIMLVAEIVADTFYPMLRDGVPNNDIAAVFDRIHRDEVRHIEFHANTLPPILADWTNLQRLAGRLIWNLTAAGASIVVAVDHRATLRSCGISVRTFVGRVNKARRNLDRRLFWF